MRPKQRAAFTVRDVRSARELWQRIAPTVEDALDQELTRKRTAEAGGRRLSRAEVDAALGRGAR